MNLKTCIGAGFHKCLHFETTLGEVDLRKKNNVKVSKRFAESMGIKNPNYHYAHLDCLRKIEEEVN